MDPATANLVGNFEVLWAGLDGQFGTADDGTNTLSQVSNSGLGVQYRIVNGPLQSGLHRLKVSTNLTDRAGNRLAQNFVRTFYMEPVPGFVFEDQDNDNNATATPLVLVEDPAGLRSGGGQGNLWTHSNNGEEDWWSFTVVTNEFLTVGMESLGSPGSSSLQI